MCILHRRTAWISSSDKSNSSDVVRYVCRPMQPDGFLSTQEPVVLNFLNYDHTKLLVDASATRWLQNRRRTGTSTIHHVCNYASYDVQPFTSPFLLTNPKLCLTREYRVLVLFYKVPIIINIYLNTVLNNFCGRCVK